MEMYAFAKENHGLLNAQEKCETGPKNHPNQCCHSPQRNGGLKELGTTNHPLERVALGEHP